MYDVVTSERVEFGDGVERLAMDDGPASIDLLGEDDHSID